jgi:hypothetical protein
MLSVPTLDGPTKLTIPAATQPNTLLRLRGKGLPEFGGTRRGDLFVTVCVHIPENLNPEQRELYQRLAALEPLTPPRPQTQEARAPTRPTPNDEVPMKSFRLALMYGLVLWVIPFAAVLLFPVRNDQRLLFEPIRPVALAICTVMLAERYLRKVEVNFVREGILLGVIWLVINLAIDLLIFVWGPMKMSLADYLIDIGVIYLMVPAITIGMGHLLARRHSMATAQR